MNVTTYTYLKIAAASKSTIKGTKKSLEKYCSNSASEQPLWSLLCLYC